MLKRAVYPVKLHTPSSISSKVAYFLKHFVHFSQPHIPSHFYACTPIKAKKRFTFEKASITSIVFRKNIKVAFWLMIWSFWSWIFLQFVLFTKIFIYQYYQISYYYATVPLFHGNFRKKSKLFWKTAGVTQLFSKVHLKKCYCDARYLGKSVGDPLKIVQNESVTKKNTYWSTLWQQSQQQQNQMQYLEGTDTKTM